MLTEFPQKVIQITPWTSTVAISETEFENLRDFRYVSNTALSTRLQYVRTTKPSQDPLHTDSYKLIHTQLGVGHLNEYPEEIAEMRQQCVYHIVQVQKYKLFHYCPLNFSGYLTKFIAVR